MKQTVFLAIILAAFAVTGHAYAAGDAAAGKAKAGACAGCHGKNGEGSGVNPPLAGKSEAELAQALRDYKSGKRSNAAMKTFANALNDQDIANVSAYYASLKK